MTSVVGSSSRPGKEWYMSQGYRSMGMSRREDIMRLVEAQIAGNVDLSPEEMVDAAFIMVDKIDKLIDRDAPEDVQLR